MELISREDVFKVIDEFYEMWKPTEENIKARYCLDNLAEYLKDIPTIESRPTGGDLKKVLIKYLSTEPKLTEAVIDLQGLYRAPNRPTGKWIEKTEVYDDLVYECSECGEPWTLIDGTPELNNMNYCPNCGAKMEGE